MAEHPLFSCGNCTTQYQYRAEMPNSISFADFNINCKLTTADHSLDEFAILLTMGCKSTCTVLFSFLVSFTGIGFFCSLFSAGVVHVVTLPQKAVMSWQERWLGSESILCVYIWAACAVFGCFLTQEIYLSGFIRSTILLLTWSQAIAGISLLWRYPMY